MELINELRMLAEDLHVNGYNRYSATMSKAADELASLQRYRTAYNEWVDKTEWVQADTSLPAKYLGMHLADVLKDMISEPLDRFEAAESARCDDYQNRMTALDRNAEQLAKLEAAEKNLSCCQAEREEAAALFLSVKTRLTEERDALRAKVERMTKRLHLILEEPENTMSNSKALREMVKQARLALEESK